jgi:hypothetical protein
MKPVLGTEDLALPDVAPLLISIVSFRLKANRNGEQMKMEFFTRDQNICGKSSQ